MVINWVNHVDITTAYFSSVYVNTGSEDFNILRTSLGTLNHDFCIYVRIVGKWFKLINLFIYNRILFIE